MLSPQATQGISLWQDLFFASALRLVAEDLI